jgi:hypothetical protein
METAVLRNSELAAVALTGSALFAAFNGIPSR